MTSKAMNRRRPPPRRDRWLTLLEVAERLEACGVKIPTDPGQRRKHVRRIFLRLEERDGTEYLRSRCGRRVPGSRLYVSISALEQLTPWDPGTLGAIRGNVDDLAMRLRRVERAIDRVERVIAGRERER